MSDANARRAERLAFAEGRDPHDVATLTRRLRDGSLARERVELAAYCGHEWAPVVLGHGSRAATGWPDWLVARMTNDEGGPVVGMAVWLRGLERWGHEVCVRAAVASAREALASHEDEWLQAVLLGPDVASMLVGVQPVREAIQAALIEWALS